MANLVVQIRIDTSGIVPSTFGDFQLSLENNRRYSLDHFLNDRQYSELLLVSKINCERSKLRQIVTQINANRVTSENPVILFETLFICSRYLNIRHLYRILTCLDPIYTTEYAVYAIPIPHKRL